MYKNKKRLVLNILAVLTIIFIIRLYIDNNVYEVNYIDYVDSEIPNSFNETTILHISDLHNKSYGENNINLINEVNKISPDYIFLTGDMVSAEDTNFTNFYNFASAIGNEYPCYYILGNHEMDLSNANRKNIYDK